MDDEFTLPPERSWPATAVGGQGPLAEDPELRVVVVLDRRACSMAAVHEALSLALRHRTELEVALVNTRPGHLSGLAGWAMVPPAVLAALDESMASLVFHQVAAELGPSAIGWHFAILGQAELVALMHDPAGAGVLLVVPRHSAWLRGPLVAAASHLTSVPAAARRIAVVPCTHRQITDQAA